MKKNRLTLFTAVLLSSCILFSSCIGSFGLSKKLLSWNQNVGDKFVNELVFFAFWILPVYEISMLADVVVINSIEFWSGSNPIASNTQQIQGENGKYLVESHENGYTITDETNGTVTEFVYDNTDDSWSVEANGNSTKFMTFTDKNHVDMYLPGGETMNVEISQAGVLAFKNIIENSAYYANK